MSSTDNKVVITNEQQRADQSFQRIFENNPHSNITPRVLLSTTTLVGK